MQKEAAKKLIRDTLEKPFNKEQFSVFIKNLLNHLEYAPFPRPRTGQMIFADFRNHISSLDRVGKYTDSDGRKLDVLIVKLSKTTSLERARSKLRNFVAKYLKESQGGQYKEAALVAFVSPNEKDWRFSFVKMEYKFDTTKQGKPKVKEEFTPAKRYSFLVGEYENSHTAQSSLLPILENSENDPSLLDLEDAFSIESVTKEFFEKYRELFIEIKESLDQIVQKDKAIKADFEEKGVDTVDFSKKLLGQIVFLYFLQKKGWFGVQRKSAWGTGSKIFLRELFKKKHTDYQNYFNDILEPLFYEALANGERKDDYYRLFDCYIPFLNGGLFDPLNNYDWVHTDILIPNDLFSNKIKTKQGDTGTGILDVLDRYNFTVKEDEPLEKEVAIDPEMLGKVFENLLEVKDRKSKGTYYTPREIVHYMCQESLINYLATELKDQMKREDIETLIKHGETALENDALVTEQGEERGRYKYKLPQSVREYNSSIDHKLAEIKVCDPAVGSGAFLVGMMSEIVKTRSVLARLNSPDQEPNIYDFKRDAIQDSLHGVDLDLGAVEIAKLRLWLSLIVDEDNYKHIKPLPNLDYKIMQGNSLLEEYEGIKLIDERFFEKHEEKEQVQKQLKAQQSKLQSEYFELHSNNSLGPNKKIEIETSLKAIDKKLKALDQPKPNGQEPFDIFGQTEAQSKADKLLELHEQFFNVYHKKEKDRLHKQIEQLTWDLIEATLKSKGKENKLEDVKRCQRTNTNPFFLWKLSFADVFREKGGFDVVIANPPYGADIDKRDLKRMMAKASITTNSNSAALFIDFGINQYLSENGTLSYIVPKSLLYSERWFGLVKALLGRTLSLVDVEKAFEKVKLEQVVFVLGNSVIRDSYVAKKFVDSVFTNTICIDNAVALKLRAWICDVTERELAICHKIKAQKHIVMADISQTKRGIGLQRFLKTKGHYPVIGGINISRFGLDGIKGYLPKLEVEKRKKKLSFLQQPKIVSQDVIAHVQNPHPHIIIMSHFDKSGEVIGLDTVQNTVLNNGSYNHEFILGILNSTLISWYTYRFIYCSAIRTMHFDNYYLGKIPIPQVNPAKQQNLSIIVKQVIDAKEANNERDIGRLTKQIDSMIYDLYGLTPDEIAIVEGDK